MNETYPYVVEVKHHPRAKKTYCFAVPTSLAYYIVPGTRLEVDTRQGKAFAIATGRASCDPEKVKEMTNRTGATEALRPVTAIHTLVDPRSIDVPAKFLMTPPSWGKIRAREREYARCGSFQTRIEIAGLWLTLMDGYSAYVVAKRLGLTAISVWVIAESEEEREAYGRELG